MRVLLDVDGILANFFDAAINTIEDFTGQSYPRDLFMEWDIFSYFPDDVKHKFFEVCNQPGWCLNIPVYEGAKEAVEVLREKYDLYIVTTPMNHSRNWVWEREAWLKRHFDIDPDRIVHTSAKYLCLGDVLIDDKPENISKWQKEHSKGYGLLWDQPYNRVDDVGIRVCSWEQTLDFLKTNSEFF
jgi:5'(3')-deoxyribonucleotidase